MLVLLWLLILWLLVLLWLLILWLLILWLLVLLLLLLILVLILWLLWPLMSHRYHQLHRFPDMVAVVAAVDQAHSHCFCTSSWHHPVSSFFSWVFSEWLKE